MHLPMLSSIIVQPSRFQPGPPARDVILRLPPFLSLIAGSRHDLPFGEVAEFDEFAE